ncbi:hypothetical protein BDV10DRAFT_59123 [Aspergillus recurvatus]
MADEQSPWVDWPHNYAQPSMGQLAPRVEENSNSLWRSPFYNSSNSNIQTSVNNNNNNTQSQCYQSYQQQEETYVQLEDVLRYPSYRWGPPPTREYQKQTSCAENSGLPTISLPQHSSKRATGRQLPNPIPKLQSESGDAYAASDAYSGHDPKRRRAKAPVIQAPSQAPPKVASPVYLQVRTQPVPQNTRSSSNYNTSQMPNPPASQPATQPAIQLTSQQAQRPGSQYFAPGQTRLTTQVQPQCTASPAIAQQRAYQNAPQAQSKAAPRAPPSASPLPRCNSQSAFPQTASQSLPTTVAPSPTQYTAQQHHHLVSRSNSQYSSPKQTPHALPQTVAPSETQIRSPYIPRPNSSPQTQPTNLPHNSRQSAPQPAAQRNPNQASKPDAKPTAQAVSSSTTQPTQQPPSQVSSHPIRPPATKIATPPVQQHVSQNLPHERHLFFQPASPGSQPQPQMAQASHTQPLGAQGKFATYTFWPENSADRTYLKRRTDIVSRLNEADAAQKTTYDPQTIARDILIAAGRHPTEAHLNHHLVCLRDIFTSVEMNSDLATFRWDLVDPGQPSRVMKAKTAIHTGPLQTCQTAAPHPAVQVARSINTFTPPQYPLSQTQHNFPQPTLQQVQPPLPPPQKPNPQVQSQQQPQSQPQVQLQRQQPVLSPGPQPGYQTPSTPNSMEKKRRGRPPGSTNKPKVAAPVAQPQRTLSYPVFACQWGNCQSELHNLELLEKHLFKSHVSYQITCGWKGCTFTGTLPAAELMKHAKKEHLDSLAWKLGDGPAVPTSVDREISIVPLTIPESNQPGNEDTLIFPAEYNSIRAFNKVHGNNSQLEKAGEIFRAIQRLKEHIGVGLDPGGCELATPLRNQRVSNDEDVYEVRRTS